MEADRGSMTFNADVMFGSTNAEAQGPVKRKRGRPNKVAQQRNNDPQVSMKHKERPIYGTSQNSPSLFHSPATGISSVHNNPMTVRGPAQACREFSGVESFSSPSVSIPRAMKFDGTPTNALSSTPFQSPASYHFISESPASPSPSSSLCRSMSQYNIGSPPLQSRHTPCAQRRSNNSDNNHPFRRSRDIHFADRVIKIDRPSSLAALGKSLGGLSLKNSQTNMGIHRSFVIFGEGLLRILKFSSLSEHAKAQRRVEINRNKTGGHDERQPRSASVGNVISRSETMDGNRPDRQDTLCQQENQKLEEFLEAALTVFSLFPGFHRKTQLNVIRVERLIAACERAISMIHTELTHLLYERERHFPILFGKVNVLGKEIQCTRTKQNVWTKVVSVDELMQSLRECEELSDILGDEEVWWKKETVPVPRLYPPATNSAPILEDADGTSDMPPKKRGRGRPPFSKATKALKKRKNGQPSLEEIPQAATPSSEHQRPLDPAHRALPLYFASPSTAALIPDVSSSIGVNSTIASSISRVVVDEGAAPVIGEETPLTGQVGPVGQCNHRPMVGVRRILPLRRATTWPPPGSLTSTSIDTTNSASSNSTKGTPTQVGECRAVIEYVVHCPCGHKGVARVLSSIVQTRDSPSQIQILPLSEASVAESKLTESSGIDTFGSKENSAEEKSGAGCKHFLSSSNCQAFQFRNFAPSLTLALIPTHTAANEPTSVASVENGASRSDAHLQSTQQGHPSLASPSHMPTSLPFSCVCCDGQRQTHIPLRAQNPSDSVEDLSQSKKAPRRRIVWALQDERGEAKSQQGTRSSSRRGSSDFAWAPDVFNEEEEALLLQQLSGMTTSATPTTQSISASGISATKHEDMVTHQLSPALPSSILSLMGSELLTGEEDFYVDGFDDLFALSSSQLEEVVLHSEGFAEGGGRDSSS